MHAHVVVVCATDLRIDFGNEFDVLGIRCRAHDIDGCIDDGCKVAWLHIQPQLAGDDPRHLQLQLRSMTSSPSRSST